jgi:hypothetical protein
MTTADRVRNVTADERNQEIDRRTEANLRRYEGREPAAITRRIAELDREWDIERVLESNAGALALTGLALGATRDRKWLILPGVVLPFLIQHALMGWCPPVPLFRRLGVRTRKEIDEEKYALKVMRGDFSATTPHQSAREAMLTARA